MLNGLSKSAIQGEKFIETLIDLLLFSNSNNIRQANPQIKISF